MRVNPNYVTNLVSALDGAQAREQQLSTELSSGMRFSSLDEDPAAAGRNVLLLNQIQRDDSFTQSASLVTGQLQVADSALGSVVAELNQAITLATAANNGTKNADDLKSIASQISGILGEIESLANTGYQGQYIFAGGKTTTLPFSTSAGVTTYMGDGDVNHLHTPNGQKIQLNVPGDQIFLGPTSVFGVLNSLVADFSSGTVNSAQASADTESLQRVTIDNSITQLTAASGAINTEKAQLTAAQTDLMQADVATVATQLSLAKTQETALESVVVQLGSGSLFDKLR
jgi:flagellar hook-associated protein 3 FlgL